MPSFDYPFKTEPDQCIILSAHHFACSTRGAFKHPLPALRQSPPPRISSPRSRTQWSDVGRARPTSHRNLFDPPPTLLQPSTHPTPHRHPQRRCQQWMRSRPSSIGSTKSQTSRKLSRISTSAWSCCKLREMGLLKVRGRF